MGTPAIIYISLGSNLGNKQLHLQNALQAIHQKVGAILRVSSIWETEAIGFEGEDFYNAVAKISTRLSPHETLSTIQSIEKEGGRTPKKGNEYESRTIDLDLLFYDNLIIYHSDLKIPHPRFHKRNFVLIPLQEICGSLKNPKDDLLVKEILHIANQDINKSSLVLDIPKSPFNFSKYRYIAIEGNIGAGKTSLSTMISQDFNAKLILERFAENPFLPLFYEDQKRYAFTTEMSFLADRYQQLSDDLAQFDLFSDFVVSDYYVIKSLIFSQITLSEEEYDLYQRLFYMMYKDMVKPDLYVYLRQDTDQLLENIKKRGRSYEQSIQPEYLENIRSGYSNFMKTSPNLNVKIIDVTDKDFVNSREDYLSILSEILT